jgi:hypothetical protein
MEKHLPLLVAILVLLASVHATSASAQTNNPTVFVESKDEFANDFSAGVIRKDVPVTLTADEHQAGYVARFSWATNEGSKTQGVMTALMTGVYMSGSYERVSMSIIERKSKNLVYSYTCQKGGRHMQSVAECLAKHWKEAFESGKIKMQQFTPSDLAGIQDVEAETVSVRKAGDTLPAQIVDHPPAPPVASLQIIPTPEVQTESVAEAARRLKAERAAQKDKPLS